MKRKIACQFSLPINALISISTYTYTHQQRYCHSSHHDCSQMFCLCLNFHANFRLHLFAFYSFSKHLSCVHMIPFLKSIDSLVKNLWRCFQNHYQNETRHFGVQVLNRTSRRISIENFPEEHSFRFSCSLLLRVRWCARIQSGAWKQQGRWIDTVRW